MSRASLYDEDGIDGPFERRMRKAERADAAKKLQPSFGPELSRLAKQLYAVSNAAIDLRFQLDEVDRDRESGLVWYALQWNGVPLEIEAEYGYEGDKNDMRVSCHNQNGRLTPDESTAMMEFACDTLFARYESDLELKAGVP